MSSEKEVTTAEQRLEQARHLLDFCHAYFKHEDGGEHFSDFKDQLAEWVNLNPISNLPSAPPEGAPPVAEPSPTPPVGALEGAGKERAKPLFSPLGDRSHHYETEQVMEAIGGDTTDYVRNKIEGRLHMMTAGERYTLYGAIKKLVLGGAGKGRMRDTILAVPCNVCKAAQGEVCVGAVGEWHYARYATANPPAPSVVSTPEPQPDAACGGLTWNLLDEICSEFGPPEYVETEDGEGWYWRFAGYELPVGDHLSDIIQFAAEKLSQRATLERPPVATPEPPRAGERDAFQEWFNHACRGGEVEVLVGDVESYARSAWNAAKAECEREKAKLVGALAAAKSLIEQYPQMVRRILGSKPVTNVPHLEAEAEAWLEKYAALQQADSGEKGESQ